MIFGDFNNQLSLMEQKLDRRSQGNRKLENTISRPIRHLWNTIPNITIHILIKCIWNIFQESHLLGYKISLNKMLKKFKIIPCMFFDHGGMKLEVRRKEIWNIYKFVEI